MDAPGMPAKVRLDEWLWAARFFRTRALAKEAIEGGKVQCEGQRCKVAKAVTVGTTFTIRQGSDEKTVVVLALDDTRRSAPEAALLYRETDDSRTQRETQAALRRNARAGFTAPATRPGKHQRQQLQRIKQQDKAD